MLSSDLLGVVLHPCEVDHHAGLLPDGPGVVSGWDYSGVAEANLPDGVPEASEPLRGVTPSRAGPRAPQGVAGLAVIRGICPPLAAQPIGGAPLNDRRDSTSFDSSTAIVASPSPPFSSPRRPKDPRRCRLRRARPRVRGGESGRRQGQRRLSHLAGAMRLQPMAGAASNLGRV